MAEEAESILDKVPPFGWDSKRSVDFEVALEVIGQLIGAYSSRIFDEGAKPEPDHSQIAEWQRLRAEAARVQDTLDREDTTRIEHIITEYGERARELMRAVQP